MPRKPEPPILKAIEELYQKQRKNIVLLYPLDNKTGLTDAGLRMSKDYVDGLMEQ